jgi:mono/diheme cytochrome c family protein
MTRRSAYPTALRAGLFLVLAASAGVFTAAAQAPDSLPPGVTAAMIEKGKKLFGGAGLCMACHGADAKGGMHIGPDLTDTVWVHHNGGYEEIYAQVVSGIGVAESESGNIMPPRGGSGLSDADLRAVSAYVWSLSRRRARQ